MSKMTTLRRILSVLNREEPDRVPISPRIWAYLLKEYGGASYREYLKFKEKVECYDPIIFLSPEIPNNLRSSNYFTAQKVTDVIQDDLKIKNKVISYDGKVVVKRTIETPAGTLNDEICYFEPGREYGISPYPEFIEPLIKSDDDLEKLKYLFLPPEKFSQVVDFATKYEDIKKEVGENAFLEVRPFFSPDNLMTILFGLENLFLLYYDNIELFEKALKFSHEYYKKCLIYCLECGAQCIFEVWYNMSIGAGWSPDVYRKYLIPMMKENTDIAHSYGAYVHFYDDGKIMPIVDDLKTVGFDIVATLCTEKDGGDVVPEVIKEKLGGVCTLKGNVSPITIRFGTPEDVRKEVKEAIDILGKGGGFILSTSDSIRDGSPYENVKAFFDAGLEYGKM